MVCSKSDPRFLGKLIKKISRFPWSNIIINSGRSDLILRFSFYILIGFLLTSPGFANSSTNSIDKECSLSVGISNWLPYQHFSKDGVASGKQIELIEQISRLADCDIEYVGVKFSDGLEMLKDGTLDFQMNASVSEERAEYGLFSVPYRKEFLLLYSTPKYHKACQTQSLKQLIQSGFKLGVQYKLVYGSELTEIQKDPELNKRLVYSKNNMQHVELVKENGLDGVIDDPIVVSYRSVSTSGNTRLQSCPIVVSSAPVSLLFSKKSVSVDVVQRFNRAIQEVQKSYQFKKNWTW